MDHAAALIDQNALFAQLVTGDLTLEVPTCPGWTLRQLATHVGRGDRWAATIVRERSPDPVDPRTVADGRPPEAGVAEWLHGGVRALLDAVTQTGPDEPVWTFTGPQPATWWVRRRLHEVAVHRADAALALGREYGVEPALAADGLSEWLGLVAARSAPLPEGSTLHLHATDEGLGSAGEWLLRGGERLTWEHGHGKGDAAVRGPARDLLLAALRRLPADAVEVLGDAGVWRRWLERTPF